MSIVLFIVEYILKHKTVSFMIKLGLKQHKKLWKIHKCIELNPYISEKALETWINKMVTFSETPAHESQKCQNLYDTVKAVLTKNFIEVNVHIKKDI